MWKFRTFTLEQRLFFQFFVGILLAINNGACFCFGIFSPYMKMGKFNYSQSEINLVSTIGVLVSYFSIPTGYLYDYKGPRMTILVATVLNVVGWAGLFIIFINTENPLMSTNVVVMTIFYSLSQFSSSYYESGTILTNLKMFSCYQGRVVLVQKTFMGLGSSIIAQMYVAFFVNYSSIGPFFLFLMSYGIIVGLLGVYFMQLPTSETRCLGLNVMDKETLAKGGGEPKLFKRPFIAGTVILCISVIFILAASLAENNIELNYVGRVMIGVSTIILVLSFTIMVFITPSYTENVGGYNPMQEAENESESNNYGYGTINANSEGNCANESLRQENKEELCTELSIANHTLPIDRLLKCETEELEQQQENVQTTDDKTCQLKCENVKCSEINECDNKEEINETNYTSFLISEQEKMSDLTRETDSHQLEIFSATNNSSTDCINRSRAISIVVENVAEGSNRCDDAFLDNNRKCASVHCEQICQSNNAHNIANNFNITTTTTITNNNNNNNNIISSSSNTTLPHISEKIEEMLSPLTMSEQRVILNEHSLGENLCHREIWLLWFVCFGAWSAMTLVQSNSSQIYQSISFDNFELTVNSVFVSVFGVASALGRVLVGLAHPILQRRGIFITCFLFVAPILNVIGLLFFLFVPVSVLFLPFCLVGLATGVSWGSTVLIITAFFTNRNCGKHYSWLYTAGMISPIIFNTGLFGPIYDHYSSVQGRTADKTCKGVICIWIPLVVCAIINFFAIFAAIAFMRRTSSRNGVVIESINDVNNSLEEVHENKAAKHSSEKN